MRREMESLGLSFDIDSLGLDSDGNNSSSYLKNKISLEEIREVSEDPVGDLEKKFLKEYEIESKEDDLNFNQWKGDGEEEEQFEGDYEEVDDYHCANSSSNIFFPDDNEPTAVYCQEGLLL